MSALRLIELGVSALQRHVHRLNQVERPSSFYTFAAWLPAQQVVDRGSREKALGRREEGGEEGRTVEGG